MYQYNIFTFSQRWSCSIPK